MPSSRVMALPVPATECAGRARSVSQLTGEMARLREDAWREFHALYFDRLLAYAVTLHRGQRALAEDSVQAGFVRAVKHIRRFDDETVFWSWLTLLVRCAAADQGRKLAAGSRLREALLEEEASAWTPTVQGDAPASMFVLLDEVLAQLDADDRALLEAKYVTGHATAELATSREVTPKVIENRLRRLRKRLKAQIRALAKRSHA